MKTNLDLVRFCKKAHNEKWGYVWGTFGLVLTHWLFEQKLKQYPTAVGRYKSFIENTWLNGRTADCVGLIKGALWEDDGRIKYDVNSDCNANMMIVRSTKTGPMDTMPDIPGILVWKRGHIGVYVGNGQVIEANSTKKGVIMTPLTGPGSTKWTRWGKSKYFDYVEVPQIEEDTEDVSPWALSAWNKAKDKGINDGFGAKNHVTEEQLMVFFDKVGLLD